MSSQEILFLRKLVHELQDQVAALTEHSYAVDEALKATAVIFTEMGDALKAANIDARLAALEQATSQVVEPAPDEYPITGTSNPDKKTVSVLVEIPQALNDRVLTLISKDSDFKDYDDFAIQAFRQLIYITESTRYEGEDV